MHFPGRARFAVPELQIPTPELLNLSKSSLAGCRQISIRGAAVFNSSQKAPHFRAKFNPEGAGSDQTEGITT